MLFHVVSQFWTTAIFHTVSHNYMSCLHSTCAVHTEAKSEEAIDLRCWGLLLTMIFSCLAVLWQQLFVDTESNNPTRDMVQDVWSSTWVLKAPACNKKWTEQVGQVKSTIGEMGNAKMFSFNSCSENCLRNGLTGMTELRERGLPTRDAVNSWAGWRVGKYSQCIQEWRSVAAPSFSRVESCWGCRWCGSDWSCHHLRRTNATGIYHMMIWI